MKISNDVFQSKFYALQKVTNKEMPLSIAKILMRNIEELRKGQQEFEKQRLELAQKYAKKDKNDRFIIKD